MKSPGKGLVKVTNILFVVFGLIVVLFSLFGLAALAWGGNVLDVVKGTFGDIVPMAGLAGLIFNICLLALGVLTSVIGILGVKRNADPAKAGFFASWGIALCLVYLVYTAVATALADFPPLGVIGVMLPILYIVGGSMKKKAAKQPAAPAA